MARPQHRLPLKGSSSPAPRPDQASHPAAAAGSPMFIEPERRHGYFSDRKGELQARREALRGEIQESLLRSREEGHARLAGEVHDRKDESLADLLVDINLADVRRDVGEIRDIDAALERLGHGTYGVCIECGNPIADERLHAYPIAKRCTACQQRHEKTRSASPIPKL